MQKTKEQIQRSQNAPVLTFGKYKGTRITEVPMSYLRWMLSQKFDPELLEYAREKVGKIVPGVDIDITAHAIDQFSLRFIERWLNREKKDIGMHRFLLQLSLCALAEGEDISKNRHQDDSTIMLYEDMKFVFNREGELKCLITIM